MEIWEVIARASIGDLVARYNSNGDTGRFAQVLELFADDAVMVVEDTTYEGKDEILTVFTGAQDNLRTDATDRAPAYIRHHTATHQVDFRDEAHATGRCYFQVLSPIGLDHWGRYADTYACVDGTWRFTRRHVTVDGQAPNSVFPASDG